MSLIRLILAAAALSAIFAPGVTAGHVDLGGARAIDLAASTASVDGDGAVKRLIAQEEARGDDPRVCWPGCRPPVAAEARDGSPILPILLGALAAAGAAVLLAHSVRGRKTRPAPATRA